MAPTMLQRSLAPILDVASKVLALLEGLVAEGALVESWSGNRELRFDLGLDSDSIMVAGGSSWPI